MRRTRSPKTAPGLCAWLARIASSRCFSRSKAAGSLIRRGELQIDQLQRGLEILRRARSADALRRARDRRRRAGDLAGQQLAEIDRREAADAGQADQRRGQRRVEVVLRRGQRQPAARVRREDDLVVAEVGRLQPDLDAVRQRQHGHADLRNLAARADRARRRRLGEQRAAGHLVAPRRRRSRSRPRAARRAATARSPPPGPAFSGAVGDARRGCPR